MRRELERSKDRSMGCCGGGGRGPARPRPAEGQAVRSPALRCHADAQFPLRSCGPRTDMQCAWLRTYLTYTVPRCLWQSQQTGRFRRVAGWRLDKLGRRLVNVSQYAVAGNWVSSALAVDPAVVLFFSLSFFSPWMYGKTDARRLQAWGCAVWKKVG